MGTWGNGIYENDGTLDRLASRRALAAVLADPEKAAEHSTRTPAACAAIGHALLAG